MHYIRKTLRNKIKKTLDYISTRQDWFRKRSNIERCLKNLELLNQPLDQKLIDFDKEKKNFYGKYDVTIMTERNVMLYFLRNWTNLESHESRISEGQQIIRELRGEVMQMKASVVPPNPTRDIEAKIESQKS